MDKSNNHRSGGERFWDKAWFKTLTKLAGLLGITLGILASWQTIFPESTPVIRWVAQMIALGLLVGGWLLLAWGSRDAIRSWSYPWQCVVWSIPILIVIGWLGWPWPRVQGWFTQPATVEKTVIPGSELSLSTEEWNVLTPCQKMTTADWLSEVESLYEVKLAMSNTYKEPIGDTEARDELRVRAKGGFLKVLFKRIDDDKDDWRRLPKDSADIVFEMDQNDGSVVPANPQYLRKYWSENICLDF